LNCACGEGTRAVHLSTDYEKIGWNVGALRLQTDAVAGETVVLMTSLDEIVQDLPVQFIKIDVEGMGASVLAGASRVLQQARPGVYFEVLDLMR
jgi:FkbM family methyltransferase